MKFVEAIIGSYTDPNFRKKVQLVVCPLCDGEQFRMMDMDGAMHYQCVECKQFFCNNESHTHN